MDSLHSIATALVAEGKGILAADERTSSIGKRFAKIGVENTEANRQAYRELLFTTEGIEQYISGVIMFDETIRQSTKSGTPFPELLKDRGIHVGIKVDMGTVPFEESEETITEGLDELSERLAEYRELGATFAKWRAVIRISDTAPTDRAITANADALARYAALCQEAGIVPIVEPEVLMNGNHTIEQCYEVTKRTLTVVFAALNAEAVTLDGMLLKPNMVISGKDALEQVDAARVAEMTIQCFREVVPAEVPGIVFLSGGQSEQQASENLNAMGSMEDEKPWELSFSFGRALQASALEAWGGKEQHVSAAQAAFLKRAMLSSKARSGEYSVEMEQ